MLCLPGYITQFGCWSMNQVNVVTKPIYLNIILYCSSPSLPPTNKFSNSGMFPPYQLMESGIPKLGPPCCIGHNIFDWCGTDYNSLNN
jgi:hypothetical protein